METYLAVGITGTVAWAIATKTCLVVSIAVDVAGAIEVNTFLARV